MGLRFVPVGENLGRLDSDVDLTIPTADAGDDQTVLVEAEVTLDGSGSSDTQDRILTYLWAQTSGTTVTLNSTTVVSPTFAAPAGAATLVFTLVVNNGLYNSATNSVTINVNAPA
jgi:chitinase